MLYIFSSGDNSSYRTDDFSFSFPQQNSLSDFYKLRLILEPKKN